MIQRTLRKLECFEAEIQNWDEKLEIVWFREKLLLYWKQKLYMWLTSQLNKYHISVSNHRGKNISFFCGLKVIFLVEFFSLDEMWFILFHHLFNHFSTGNCLVLLNYHLEQEEEREAKSKVDVVSSYNGNALASSQSV